MLLQDACKPAFTNSALTAPANQLFSRMPPTVMTFLFGTTADLSASSRSSEVLSMDRGLIDGVAYGLTGESEVLADG